MGHFLANKGWWISFLRWVIMYPAFREISLMTLGIGLGIYSLVAWQLDLLPLMLVSAGIYLLSWTVHAISDRGGFIEMFFWILGAFLWGFSTPLVIFTAYQILKFIYQLTAT